MKKTILALVVFLCLGLSACDNSIVEKEESSDSVPDSSASENNMGDTTDVSGSQEDASTAIGAVENSKPEIVEITNDNWDQFFDIVPVHASWPYVINGSDDKVYYLNYNGFEFVLKDKYIHNYLDKSGWFISDELLDTIHGPDSWALFKDDIEKYQSKGLIYFPQGPDIEATFIIQYDGDILGTDNEGEYSELRFPVGYVAENESIEVERFVSICPTDYRDFVLFQYTKDDELQAPGKLAFDLLLNEVQTVYTDPPLLPTDNEIREKLVGDKLFYHLISVANYPSNIANQNTESDNTGEILDHFTISIKDISGTIPIWK